MSSPAPSSSSCSLVGQGGAKKQTLALPQTEPNRNQTDKSKRLFPRRLWDLIHDEKFNFCLRWSDDGQRVFLGRSEFETHYLRTQHNQFHTQKAISFVRQMNMYGFRKVDDFYYENDNFKRNCPHLLKNMVRRHSNRFGGSATGAQQRQHPHSSATSNSSSQASDVCAESASEALAGSASYMQQPTNTPHGRLSTLRRRATAAAAVAAAAQQRQPSPVSDFTCSLSPLPLRVSPSLAHSPFGGHSAPIISVEALQQQSSFVAAPTLAAAAAAAHSDDSRPAAAAPIEPQLGSTLYRRLAVELGCGGGGSGGESSPAGHQQQQQQQQHQPQAQLPELAAGFGCMASVAEQLHNIAAMASLWGGASAGAALGGLPQAPLQQRQLGGLANLVNLTTSSDEQTQNSAKSLLQSFTASAASLAYQQNLTGAAGNSAQDYQRQSTASAALLNPFFVNLIAAAAAAAAASSSEAQQRDGAPLELVTSNNSSSPQSPAGARHAHSATAPAPAAIRLAARGRQSATPPDRHSVAASFNEHHQQQL